MLTFLSPHLLEILAVAFGLMNIYLAARANILNWLFGILTVSLYFIIFFQAKLYADMSLQVVFLILQFYGWYQWLFGSETHSKLPIKKTPFVIYLSATTAILFLFGLIAMMLFRYTDSTTVYLDAFITAASLVAQWMMTKKWLEHWFLWMVVDAVSIKMYLLKDLYFTSGLYGIFFLLCVYGYFHWKKQIA